jgi:hypothetical protein
VGEDQANNYSSQPTSEERDRDPLVELLRPVGSFFREHPAVVGSLLYLQVTIIGVIYSWALYRRFDINIFDYAEANDFLLAAFKDPLVLGMSLFSLFYFPAAIWIMNKIAARYYLERFNLSHLFWRRVIRTAVVLFYLLALFVLPFVFANIAAYSLQASKDLPFSPAPHTSVQYRATAGSSEQTTETGLRVIGITQSFVFFYDRKDTRTLVIPTAQIVEMEHNGPKSEPKENK